MTKPPQIPCRCAARIFPHREDQFCRQLREDNAEGAAEEYAEMRRDDERERARYVNALNRNTSK